MIIAADAATIAAALDANVTFDGLSWTATRTVDGVQLTWGGRIGDGLARDLYGLWRVVPAARVAALSGIAAITAQMGELRAGITERRDTVAATTDAVDLAGHLAWLFDQIELLAAAVATLTESDS